MRNTPIGKGRVTGIAVALVVAAGLVVASIVRAQEGVPFLWVLPGAIIQYGILGVLAVPLWRFCAWTLRGDRPRALLAALHAAVGVAVVGTWQGSYVGLALLAAGDDALSSLRVAGLWYMLGAFFQYGVLVAGMLLVQTSEKLRRQTEREAALRVMAREAELRALKAQFRPHFFFNVINSLYALIESDPRRAQEMLDRVSRLMRQTLEVADDAWATLDWEMESVRAYLEIERIRLGDRLEISIDAEEGVRQVDVPPLLLQPLVENAIKHGVAPHSGPGSVAVRARWSDGDLVLTVRDSGPGPAGDEAEGDGRGLAMTRQRLEALYGDGASIEAGRLEPSGYEVTLRLPAGGGERSS